MTVFKNLLSINPVLLASAIFISVQISHPLLYAQEKNKEKANYISSPETIRLQREFTAMIEKFAKEKSQEDVAMTIQLGRKTDKLEGHRFVTMRSVIIKLEKGSAKNITFTSEQVNEANLHSAKRTLINEDLTSTDLSQIRIITEVTYGKTQDYTLGSLENRESRAKFSSFYRKQLREAVNYMSRYFARKSEEERAILSRSIMIGITQK